MTRPVAGRPSPWLALAGWLAVTYLASALGAIASMNAPSFYAELDRPAWAPPSSWFGPVWTALYGMMAVAAWLVWQVRGLSGPLVLYLAQLAVNALWSWLFFAWRMGGAAFADIVVLWVMIAATIALFQRIRPLAAWLLVPYLLWVAYAGALNYEVWQRNPQVLG